MATIDNTTNSNDDNIIAIIDGVVYQKKPQGRPRNPARWKENGTHITGSLTPGYYKKRYLEINKITTTCPYCGTEIQYLDNVKTHQKTKKCMTMKKHLEEKLNVPNN